MGKPLPNLKRNPFPRRICLDGSRGRETGAVDTHTKLEKSGHLRGADGWDHSEPQCAYANMQSRKKWIVVYDNHPLGRQSTPLMIQRVIGTETYVGAGLLTNEFASIFRQL